MPATDELSVLGGATRYLFQSILLIRGTDLSAATPCQDWDLRHLLRHIHTSLEQFTDMLAVRQLDTDVDTDAGPRPQTNPVAALRIGIIDLLLAATSLPTTGRWCEIWGRILPAKTVIYVAAIEMVLHAWDIAQACRTHHPVPADLASALLGVAPPLAEAGLAEHVFAKPVEVSTTATPGDQLIALFGRRALFHEVPAAK
ncbi:MAG: TIGR03086 family metal-binding protein [Mycobacterium sp.]|uniref:TIGR03086 family metal-binding protein n=1 Tax=Mycobacterium sp. TaxID=1785 RepID=UPI003C52E735